jgi:hypothetical protein
MTAINRLTEMKAAIGQCSRRAQHDAPSALLLRCQDRAEEEEHAAEHQRARHHHERDKCQWVHESGSNRLHDQSTRHQKS